MSRLETFDLRRASAGERVAAETDLLSLRLTEVRAPRVSSAATSVRNIESVTSDVADAHVLRSVLSPRAWAEATRSKFARSF